MAIVSFFSIKEEQEMINEMDEFDDFGQTFSIRGALSELIFDERHSKELPPQDSLCLLSSTV